MKSKQQTKIIKGPRNQKKHKSVYGCNKIYHKIFISINICLYDKQLPLSCNRWKLQMAHILQNKKRF